MHNEPSTTVDIDEAALQTLRRLRVGNALDNGWISDRDILAKLFASDMQNVVVQHMKILRDAGLVVRDPNGRSRALAPLRLEASTREARTANYIAYVDGVAERFHESPEVRLRFAKAFTEIRKLYGYHRFHGDASCLLVPTGIVWTPVGPRASGAIVFQVDERGVQVLEAPAESFVHSLDQPLALPRHDLLVKPFDGSLPAEFAKMTISPFAEDASGFPSRMHKLAKGVLLTAFRDIGGVARHLGVSEDHVRARASSIRLSMSLATPIARHFRPSLWSILDPEMRKVAVGIPSSTYSRYDWLHGRDTTTRLRRVQATALYPLLADQLMAMEGVIDDGQPLDPALAQMTGMPVANLRRLRGVSRQKAGRAYHDIVAMAPHLMAVLRRASPDHLPPKGGWASLQKLGEWLHIFEHEGGIERLALHELFDRKLADAYLKDPDAIVKRLSEFFDALRDIVDTVRQIVARRWDGSERRDDHHALVDRILPSVVEAALGRARSLASIDSFSKRWHVATAGLVVAKRRFRRLDTGEKTMTWLPLSSDWEHARGRLTWITDEDELEAEGILQSHCVGTYGSRCVARISHIARVEADDGRATVEFRWDGKKRRLAAVQLVSRGNGAPSDGCVAIARSFFESARRGDGIDRRAKRTRKEKADRRPRSLPMSDAARAALIDAYQEVMPGLRDLIDALEHGAHADKAGCARP